MATPLSADRLLAALRAEGVTVVEHPGWRGHHRNRVGAWGPVNGVMIHHTVSSGTASSVALCFDGYAGLPGPLCHGVIAKDGTVHLVSDGRANHAGGGDPSVLRAVVTEAYGDRPPAPREHQGSAGAVDGNSRFYGFECVNLGNGTDPWPAAQLDAIERVSAALCRAHGWGAKSVIGHLEWSDWKSDPKGFAMPVMRDRVQKRLGAAPASRPTAPARPATPKYHPFPGTQFFRDAPSSPVITAMGRRLTAEGCARYRIGPGPRWTEADRQSYAAWQRKLGFRGADADGWPGATSWNALKVPHTP
ncbi:N-acetylmuramoyl-L-alanine amidase [Streptomyces sp. R302]|uniref:peptidoglycan-binding protein n=1 Tax=unclassified Streptomyces TaxID=2593676 RepID=UPI00145F96D2|nr:MULTISPECIES: peptidoglycan-binding protein [unclassified Streptomyces]NML50336.1 N-acetylmuramoyl-L-alanine amidase [Streptomyces sp. R301]NML79327.1 N-acetylmuramoyl-L-alanine amidase [Streptomyces sp. R302]